jgi:hypothetical protein
MCGYIAIENEKIVGWVNSNNKTKYPRLDELNDNDEKVLSMEVGMGHMICVARLVFLNMKLGKIK